MCGRTVSTLSRNDMRRACTYTNNRGRRMRPGWRNRGPTGGGCNGGGGGTKRGASGGGQRQYHAMQSQPEQTEERGKKYFPSYNIAPSRATPVLVSRKHFEGKTSTGDGTASSDERDLMPMTWGLVPSWHKGTAKDMQYKMNNCRNEGMLERVSFKRPFEKGQRCVVLADGFYEWKTDSSGKQPYFIYFTQEHPPTDLPIKLEDDQESNTDQEMVDEPTEVSEGEPEWTGHRLLTMAGLFDKWNPPEGGDPLYTYTVITVEANDSFSWLHHRMPAILEGEEEIRSWLEFGSMESNKKARSLISPRTCLSFHPVTRAMGNIRYKDPDCIKPIELGKPQKPKSAGSKFMAAWVTKGSKASEEKSTLKQREGVSIKKEESGQKKGVTLMNWFAKKDTATDEDTKKRSGAGIAVKEEEPSPKKGRIC